MAQPLPVTLERGAGPNYEFVTLTIQPSSSSSASSSSRRRSSRSSAASFTITQSRGGPSQPQPITSFVNSASGAPFASQDEAVAFMKDVLQPQLQRDGFVAAAGAPAAAPPAAPRSSSKRRKREASPAAASPPPARPAKRARQDVDLSELFSGLSMCFSGALSRVRSELCRLVESYGAETKNTVTRKLTHLVTKTQDAQFGGTSKIQKAKRYGTAVVEEDWVHDSIASQRLLSTEPYLIDLSAVDGDDEDNSSIGSATSAAAAAAASSSSSSSSKPALKVIKEEQPDDDDDEDEFSGFEDISEDEFSGFEDVSDNEPSPAASSSSSSSSSVAKVKAPPPPPRPAPASDQPLIVELYEILKRPLPEDPSPTHDWDLEWNEDSDGIWYLSDLNLEQRSRIAAFALDKTLVRTKSGRKQPRDRTDWEWVSAGIPAMLQRLHAAGFRLVIFSNQLDVSNKRLKVTLDDVQGRIADMVGNNHQDPSRKPLNVPVFAFIATVKCRARLPHTTMWDTMIDALFDSTQVAIARSFYCGAHAGRQAFGIRKRDDYATDRMFAHNVGLPFFTPEQVFKQQPDEEPYQWRQIEPAMLLADQERLLNTRNLDAATGLPQGTDLSSFAHGLHLVLFVAMPASGKSFWAEQHLVQPFGFERVNQDTLGTKERCVRAVRAALESGRSVVVDNTNQTAHVRASYTYLGREFGARITVVRFDTPIELCYHLNGYRERLFNAPTVPRIAMLNARKRIEEPNTFAEDIDQVLRVTWVPQFATPERRRLFLHFAFVSKNRV